MYFNTPYYSLCHQQINESIIVNKSLWKSQDSDEGFMCFSYLWWGSSQPSCVNSCCNYCIHVRGNTWVYPCECSLDTDGALLDHQCKRCFARSLLQYWSQLGQICGIYRRTMWNDHNTFWLPLLTPPMHVCYGIWWTPLQLLGVC